jgi:hypothetical protein
MTGAALAHGIGGRNDLPLPLAHMIIGAAIALVVSFAALGFLWRTPMLGRVDGQALPVVFTRIVDARAPRWVLRASGLVAFGYVFMAAQFGQDSELNPTAGAVYVLLWVAVPLASLLFGPVWRLVNPLRTIHAILARVVGLRPDHGAPMPKWLGVWPAAFTLLLFVWMELVPAHNASVPALRRWIAIYVVINLVAASYLGSKWFAAGDGFEVFSTLLGRLSPVGRRRAVTRGPGDGAPRRLIGWQNPLAKLIATPPRAGLFAVVGVLLGSTAFDSISNSPRWVNRTLTSDVSPTVTGTVGLITTVALVTGVFAAAAAFSAKPAGMRTTQVAAEFAPTLVPIVVGYFIAHYWSLLIIGGQQTLVFLSDPLSRGDNWLGLSHRATDYTLAGPRFVAILQVSAIVGGHILAVLLAHEKALRLMPGARAVRGQLPMLAAMVFYTIAGLWLLFAA